MGSCYYHMESLPIEGQALTELIAKDERAYCQQRGPPFWLWFWVVLQQRQCRLVLRTLSDTPRHGCQLGS